MISFLSNAHVTEFSEYPFKDLSHADPKKFFIFLLSNYSRFSDFTSILQSKSAHSAIFIA